MDRGATGGQPMARKLSVATMIVSSPRSSSAIVHLTCSVSSSRRIEDFAPINSSNPRLGGTSTLARYPKDVLRCILQEVINGTTHIREKTARGINHVETWRGVKTAFAHDATLATKHRISSAWKVDNSLLSIALKAHKSATRSPLVPHIPRGPRGSPF